MSEIEKYIDYLATTERARVREAEDFYAREAAQMLDEITTNLKGLLAGGRMVYVKEEWGETATLENEE